jgi:hypothetical protein
MSDERGPARTDLALREAREGEIKRLSNLENFDELKAKYTELQLEKRSRETINGTEFNYNLTRLETEPGFEKRAAAEVVDWEARKAEAEKSETGKSEPAKDKEPPEQTESRAMRMQRLREITEGLDRERQERDGNESGPSRDDGGHSR